MWREKKEFKSMICLPLMDKNEVLKKQPINIVWSVCLILSSFLRAMRYAYIHPINTICFVCWDFSFLWRWVWHHRCVKWAAPYLWVKFASYQNLAVAVKCIPREVIRLLRIRQKVCKPRFQDNSYLNVIDHVQCFRITNINFMDGRSWPGKVKVIY